jgi:hypothetical protein
VKREAVGRLCIRQRLLAPRKTCPAFLEFWISKISLLFFEKRKRAHGDAEMNFFGHKNIKRGIMTANPCDFWKWYKEEYV